MADHSIKGGAKNGGLTRAGSGPARRRVRAERAFCALSASWASLRKWKSSRLRARRRFSPHPHSAKGRNATIALLHRENFKCIRIGSCLPRQLRRARFRFEGWRKRDRLSNMAGPRPATNPGPSPCHRAGGTAQKRETLALSVRIALLTPIRRRFKHVLSRST